MADAADRGWVCKGESVLSPRTVFFAKTEQARSPALSRLHASRHDSAGPGLSQQRIAATAPPPPFTRAAQGRWPSRALRVV